MKLPETPLLYKILFKCLQENVEINVEGSDLDTVFDGIVKFCKSYGTPPESLRLYDKNLRRILNFDQPFKNYDKSIIVVEVFVDL
jgi:hypothetical protein